MAQKEILKLIEQAAKEGWTQLDLSRNQLTSLPPEIAKLTNLTSLLLDDNQLTSLPPEITQLTNLIRLRLADNQLSSIPDQIFKLTSLMQLNLSSNRLIRLPPEISELVNLTDLHVHANQLTELPPQIVQLSNLKTLGLSGNQFTKIPAEITCLIELTDLSLNVNRLATLPNDISKLVNLKRLSLNGTHLTSLTPQIGTLASLVDLDLSANSLRHLPREIGRLVNLTRLELTGNQLTTLPREVVRLTNLTELELAGNRLMKLPREITKLINLRFLTLYHNQLLSLPGEIGRLTSLLKLNVSHNQLTKLPPEIAELINLTDLSIGNNQLTTIPHEITKLPNLAELDLRNNLLPIPPETLANPKDVKAIFAALAGLETGERLNEAKMLVLGDGKVGKSSVVEQLIYGTFNPQRQTTLGVEINDEMKVVQRELKGEGEPVKLNIWDFGGQEIQHSTHQFFLTTRSLYLLVVDARKGDQLTNTEYWLKLIESFGGDSPIIIVINQIDQLKGQRPLNLDRKALQEKYPIKDFVETSCETGEGILQLMAAIAREVEHLKHVRDVWPREWIAIKQRLRGMQADYIPVEKYLEICAEEGLNDEDLRRSLLGLLHDLGVVIRFPGDTEVLNPRWVTQGVYGLLTSKQLVQGQGQFDLKDVGNILAGLPDSKNRYPPHTHRRLIDVMQHFELCFEFSDRPGHYLIPRHLHDNEPDTAWDDRGALKFQYHYETLPDSIISRFIVRMSQFIHEQQYWKNGVFLESAEGEKNLAKVKADLVERKIFISVIGREQTRRAFLAVIRSAFDEINANFKIEIEQMIPVASAPEVLVSYQDLLAYEEMGEAQIVIPELRKKFSVRELLDGVEEWGIRVARWHDLKESSSLEQSAGIRPTAQPRILRVVVASPSDVQSERDVLPSVIDELNRSVAADRGLRLELSRWEIDAHPGVHSQGPQGMIDPILNIGECDLLIGIFWKRFGTPTADGKTGTEHELSLAYEAWQETGRPQIFVYFNQKPYAAKSSTEAEQWRKVHEFRDKLPTEGLWWPYKGKAEFEKLVRNHIVNYIRTLP